METQGRERDRIAKLERNIFFVVWRNYVNSERRSAWDHLMRDGHAAKHLMTALGREGGVGGDELFCFPTPDGTRPIEPDVSHLDARAVIASTTRLPISDCRGDKKAIERAGTKFEKLVLDTARRHVFRELSRHACLLNDAVASRLEAQDSKYAWLSKLSFQIPRDAELQTRGGGLGERDEADVVPDAPEIVRKGRALSKGMAVTIGFYLFVENAFPQGWGLLSSFAFDGPRTYALNRHLNLEAGLPLLDRSKLMIFELRYPRFRPINPPPRYDETTCRIKLLCTVPIEAPPPGASPSAVDTRRRFPVEDGPSLAGDPGL